MVSRDDLKKIPSKERKIVKLAMETINEQEKPRVLRNLSKLKIVEQHLEELHQNNPNLKKLSLSENRSTENLNPLQPKSEKKSSRISKSIQNVFGRVTTKKLEQATNLYEDQGDVVSSTRDKRWVTTSPRARDEQLALNMMEIAREAEDNDRMPSALKYYEKAASLGNSEAHSRQGNYYYSRESLLIIV